MSLHSDLLEQADHLSRRELKKPRQASLRRSTSTAYYALFHLLSNDASCLLGPNLNLSARARLQRSFSHSAIKDVCDKFLLQTFPAPLSALIGMPLSPQIQNVARAFKQLQDARHSADYDLNSNWNRARASQYVQVAREAFTNWAAIQKQPEANVFLLSFLLLKTLETPRN